MLITAKIPDFMPVKHTTNQTTLNHLKPGERGTIQNITNTSPFIRQRLLEMGLTRGTMIQLIRVAPMGDPVEISVRGYRLSLRRVEASSIIIKKEF